MNLATLGLCLCLSMGTNAPRDRWIAEDKFKHFVASFVITTIAASAARSSGVEPDRSAWIGAGVGASAGILKELRDAGRRGQTASFRDLTWDFAGVGASVALMRRVR
jgi:putative lipoprotein